MKRVFRLLLILSLLAAVPVPVLADGVDVKVKGEWEFAFGWVKNDAFSRSVHGDADVSSDPIVAMHRARVQIDFIMSEYLSGVLMLESGPVTWGRADGNVGVNSGGGINSDGASLAVKHLYLDWMLPETEIRVRMGLQPILVPTTRLGTPAIDSDMAGITLSVPLGDITELTLLWVRPFDNYNFDGDDPRFDETDIFGLILPLEFENLGLKLTPWFAYGRIGGGSGFYDWIFREEYGNTVGVDYIDDQNNFYSAHSARSSSSGVFWLGALLEFDLLDPLQFSLEAIYGRLRKADLTGLGGEEFMLGYGGGPRHIGTSGWYVAGTLDYKLDITDDFSMVPGIFAWWSSGDDKNAWRTGKLGRLPYLSAFETGFAATSFGTGGGFSKAGDGLISSTGLGLWGVGLQLADITNPYVEGLSHTLRVAWYSGTNSSDGVREYGGSVFGYGEDAFYLTDKDHVLEVNFDHQWELYENLTAAVELGWLRLHADREVWGDSGPGSKTGQNAWKAQVMFNFKF
ncbi:MAG: outer membrane homotrimeric porin [Desulfovibrio sp.]|jgi:hypothetical protein|nr:outer membrane homotrimeric porin [Desulfovibrio sp.]